MSCNSLLIHVFIQIVVSCNSLYQIYTNSGLLYLFISIRSVLYLDIFLQIVVCCISDQFEKDETCHDMFLYVANQLRKKVLVVVVRPSLAWQQTDLGMKIADAVSLHNYWIYNMPVSLHNHSYNMSVFIKSPSIHYITVGSTLWQSIYLATDRPWHKDHWHCKCTVTLSQNHSIPLTKHRYCW